MLVQGYLFWKWELNRFAPHPRGPPLTIAHLWKLQTVLVWRVEEASEVNDSFLNWILKSSVHQEVASLPHFIILVSVPQNLPRQFLVPCIPLVLIQVLQEGSHVYQDSTARWLTSLFRFSFTSLDCETLEHTSSLSLFVFSTLEIRVNELNHILFLPTRFSFRNVLCLPFHCKALHAMIRTKTLPINHALRLKWKPAVSGGRHLKKTVHGSSHRHPTETGWPGGNMRLPGRKLGFKPRAWRDYAPIISPNTSKTRVWCLPNTRLTRQPEVCVWKVHGVVSQTKYSRNG